MNKIYTIATCMLLSTTPASASVINGADTTIGAITFATFVDNQTNKTWLDLNNFFTGGWTYNSVEAHFSGTGYHIATTAELMVLQTSLTGTGPQEAVEREIIGGGNSINNLQRNLSWGVFDDGSAANTGLAYSWKFDANTSWGYSYDTDIMKDDVFNESVNDGNEDLGAWVVSPPTVVPLPGAVWFMGSALIGLLGYSRKNTDNNTRPVSA